MNRIEDVLKEIPRVREDLGFPPLVTPTSQIVGAQAVLNVLTGERYKTISNEVKLYLQGRYGRAPGSVNGMVRQQAIGNEDVIDIRPADLLKVPSPGEHSAKPTEFNVALHGETYHIQITGTGHHTQQNRPFYMTVDGVPEEVLVETLSELEETQEGNGATPVKGSKRPRATGPGHVSTSMPGVIVDVLVSVGDEVKAGDPVLVTEAMKMETEIQAPIAGTVKAIHVAKGDSVNPDETLIEITG